MSHQEIMGCTTCYEKLVAKYYMTCQRCYRLYCLACSWHVETAIPTQNKPIVDPYRQILLECIGCTFEKDLQIPYVLLLNYCHRKFGITKDEIRNELIHSIRHPLQTKSATKKN